MATTTTNLGLTLPASGENWNLSTWNGNMGLIDAFAGEINTNTNINSMTSTDLNTYTGSTEHVKYYKADDISQFSNIPSALSSSEWPFVLEVIKFKYYTKQIIHIFNSSLTNHITYVRQQTYTNGAITWGNWNSYVLKSKTILSNDYSNDLSVSPDLLSIIRNGSVVHVVIGYPAVSIPNDTRIGNLPADVKSLGITILKAINRTTGQPLDGTVWLVENANAIRYYGSAISNTRVLIEGIVSLDTN